MNGKNFHHHFVPHLHEDGAQHHPHLINLPALFIYLQITVALVGGFYLIKLKAPQILGTASFGAEQIIVLINKKRVENGLSALTFNAQLAAAASGKAANMLSENYWAHNAPSGKTPWSFVSAAGYRYVYAGENLARDFSDAPSTVEAWMNSPSHRSNLLDANFKETGVAVSFGSLTGREGTLVVQMFGSPVSQIPTQQNLALASPSPSPGQSQSPESKSKNLASSNPSAVPSSSPSINPGPSPSQAAQVAAINSGPTSENFSNQTTVLSSRRFAYGKLVSLGLVAFVFSLFAMEILFTVRRSHLKLRTGIIAHTLALGFLLFAIWYSVGGAIL